MTTNETTEILEALNNYTENTTLHVYDGQAAEEVRHRGIGDAVDPDDYAVAFEQAADELGITLVSIRFNEWVDGADNEVDLFEVVADRAEEIALASAVGLTEAMTPTDDFAKELVTMRFAREIAADRERLVRAVGAARDAGWRIANICILLNVSRQTVSTLLAEHRDAS